jgi:hypothetical protein
LAVLLQSPLLSASVLALVVFPVLPITVDDDNNDDDDVDGADGGRGTCCGCGCPTVVDSAWAAVELEAPPPLAVKKGVQGTMTSKPNNDSPNSARIAFAAARKRSKIQHNQSVIL